MDVFICHTYYHILIAVVEKLTIYKNVDVDLVLAYSSTNLNQIEKNSTLNSLFHKVYVITEKTEIDMENEQGKIYEAKTLIGRIVVRAIFTRKLGKFVGKYLEIDFKEYKNIRLFCDPDPIGYYLYCNNIKYYAIEDALDSYKNDIFAGWKKQFRIKKLLNILGMMYIPHGYSSNCLGVEVNSPDGICACEKNLIIQNRMELFEKLSSDDKKKIENIFLIDIPDLPSQRKTCLLLTQPLLGIYFHSIDDCIHFYKEIILKYAENCDVYIKQHPRDNIDYKKYFPDYQILSSAYPIEVLNFNSKLTFDIAITAFSTSIEGLNFIKEKYSMGYEPFLNYINKFYEK